MIELVKQTIKLIKENKELSFSEIEKAKHIFEQNSHVILSQGKEKITILVDSNTDLFEVVLFSENEFLSAKINGIYSDWDIPSLVALYVVESEIHDDTLTEGIKYSRKGMQKRVLEERVDRAKKANYKINLANNLYGEHTLINEKGKTYKVTLRDFNKKTGYINNIDWKTNKLGTTKHIIYLFRYFEENPLKINRLKKTYPFIEIYTDPLNDYKISWFFPETLEAEEAILLKNYFGNKHSIEDTEIATFSSFLYKSRDLARIKIREEVFEKVEMYFENKELDHIKQSYKLDFSSIKATLYPYQKEGVAFSVFKKGVIVADEMGLGKTLQAITTAILKKEIFNFKKTLVVCPASVKHQWKNEILKFSNESAIVVEGYPDDRNKIYLNDTSFFHIVNYETILRDLSSINKSGYDFVILDEAQKIKNYETKTANSVKAIDRKHALVITGTPLENKLLDLYSIVQFLDQKFLAPQWEFSYQHCIFDSKHKNKIRGYYNLQNLKKRLDAILIRRGKQEVFEQLPDVIQKDIFVSLSDEQAGMHASFARGIASILSKKFKTTYDWQKLMHLLTNMRMVCDSSYLIDKETHYSPKLIELKDILIEKLDIKNTDRKIIIFSEWVTMLGLISDMLKKEGITFTTLTGKVPVKKRGALIKEFEDNPDCRIFLSSESGGTGLNLQIADTVINFELPWNPAKKNQRIGRIDRIGQQKQKLYVFNLLSYNSIEMKIAAGLLLKQNLFEGVLNSDSLTDEVDFSEKGKSQFIKQLEEIVSDDDFENLIDDDINIEDQEHEELQDLVSEIETEITMAKILEESEIKKEPIVTQDIKKLEPDYDQMEAVMTKGMEFLTGIFNMSTGNELSATGEKPKVKVNKETGEVSISFKMDI
ncbi:DEAD/DEAH box helicase [Changchengzhania lutea]|uniref:DEAD/DEAH box helicase n=1 Tax=Changchengzhania lutea TaxID=2049305 RepID=UPI00115CBDDB|nr:DEAD/DEAH box helicase [Changchengzhania lutea]